jgi:hypothetical protein
MQINTLNQKLLDSESQNPGAHAEENRVFSSNSFLRAGLHIYRAQDEIRLKTPYVGV